MDSVCHAISFGGMEGSIARIVEDRLDDGDPVTGRIQSNVSGVTMIAGTTSTAGAYAEDERYDMAFRL